jgi:hypothetical protein
MTRTCRRPAALLLRASACFALLAPAAAQGADPSKDAQRMGSPMALPPGQTVETMWPAPTAEDWAKPVLVRWQRSVADAVKIATETGRPILVCVNMDGEPASEHFAGVRYRDPETASLLEPYVCVPASVYRHTPRDFDAQGRRVPCPRLGQVTCGEHIAAETELYEKYFEGQRIAPRHILLEPDGRKTYDVFYSWDTATVYTAFRTGLEGRELPPPYRGDLPLAERGASVDALDRTAVEEAYVTGSREVRRALLQAVAENPGVQQTDLLRLALFGLDVELAKLARSTLAQGTNEAAVDLIAEALKHPMDPAEREALLAAAERLAREFPRARTLVAVQRGLARPSSRVDVEAWTAGLADEYRASAVVAVENRAAESENRPDDAAARLAFAEALASRAQEPGTEREYAALLLEDARLALEAARGLGAEGWRVDAVSAAVLLARGEEEAAVARALAAVEGGMPRTGEGLDARTAVNVLALFARARQRAIAQAYRERREWPPEWLADVHAAYAVLVEHPLGTDVHVADCHDFLRWLGATPRAVETLERGLARFPDSGLLHERLRMRLLYDQGPEGLEAEYARRLAAPERAPTLEWFAGLASIVAAESHRRAGDVEAALAAYARGLALYEQAAAANSEHRASAEHYVAIALAGRAKLALERGALDEATAEILASFERAPDSAAAFDGLGNTGIDTARMLLARAEREGRAELVARVQAGLDALGPALLDAPDLQRGVPAEGARAGDRRRREGGGR